MEEKKDKGKNDGKWRCPTCQVVADVEGRDMTVRIIGFTWPKHSDCEFSNDIDHIDFSKLERVS